MKKFVSIINKNFWDNILMLNKGENFSFMGEDIIKGNINNIKVCRVGDIKKNENKKILKNYIFEKDYTEDYKKLNIKKKLSTNLKIIMSIYQNLIITLI